MIIDARTLESGLELSADVVIVGAGVAGIVLALEFERRGIDALVLESGGHKPEIANRDLYRGESGGIPYRFADGCRSRYLGGSSNCWGGWCRPFDDWDFEKREWIPNSGWPIKASDVTPYYPRTHEFLDLGPFNFDIGAFEAEIGKHHVRRMPLPSGRVWDLIAQFSPPTRMGRKYSAELKAARHVRVVLNANVVDIETDPDARTVRRLKCRTLSGRSFAAKGSKFILATGGIENARLLLAANTVRPNGLGNDHDVVGRYYLEHPRLYSGSIRFNGDWGRNMMYDIKFHYHNAAVQAFGQKFAGAFALTRETQEAERVMNGRVWLCSMFPGDEQPAAKSLERIKHRLERKEEPGPTLLEDLFTVARSPLQTAGFLGGRLFRLRSLIRDVRFQAIVEPNPDPESRITLLPHSRDALGMPRVKVTWQLGDIVRRTFDRNFAILADEMRLAGIAQTTLDAPMEGTGGWHPTFENQGTWHHMGSTRMHDSPKYGVVDRNCRVHGMSNLFVAGSSVFTTGAANLPTQTIVALTLRLSDHLADRLREAEATAQALPA